MKKLILSLLLVLLPLVASAHDFEVDGIYYSITDNEKLTVEVIYRGQTPSSYENEYSSNVVIPKTVTFNSKTYNVTSIEDRAFEECSGLTSVTIPNSVTSIGNFAFYECSSLTSITIPDGVTSIGNSAFYKCSSLTSITIPDGVTSIGTSAFDGTAWYNNQPDGVIYEGKVAYKYKGTMPSNTSIELAEGTLVIAGGAFYDCSSLTSVTIPEGVTSIGRSAFYGCSSLTSITIPNSVTSIGENAFMDCSNLTSVTIPNSVTSIGNSAFYKCSSLTSVTIPNSVTSIGDHAFYYCSSLTSVIIPNSVTSIGAYTFNGCSGLTSVTIPNSVKSIDASAFMYCSGLSEVHVSDIAAWCNIYFKGEDANPLSYAQHLYLNGKELTTLETLEGVTSIGDCAFCHCLGLTSANIPNSVTTIGEHAFKDCSGLSEVTIPNSVTTIGQYAFCNCSGLKSITIGSGVTIIPEASFALCTNLTSVTIPASVTQIEYGAFYGCTSLTDVYCLAEDLPATLSDVFAELNYENATLHVPAASVEEYRNTVPWSSFGNIIAIKQQLESTAITINQYGSGTYCSEYALDFTNVEGMKAYVGIGFNTRTNTLIMSPVRTVKPGVGLFIKGEPGVYNIPIIDSSDENYINLLVGTLNKVTVNTQSVDGQYINYKYTTKSGEAEPMFYVFSNNSSLSANKAYLRLPTDWLPSISTAKNINIAFDNEDITGIDEFVIDSLDGKPVVYDLQGRRVINPEEGLYIVNGKKVLIK